jgi:hypothetical protein
MTSLLDAMMFALARASRPERRHLVFVFTDGYDNTSLMGYGAIPELAGRTDAVLYIALVRVTGAPDEWPNSSFDALARARRRAPAAPSPRPARRRTTSSCRSRRRSSRFRHSYTLYYVRTNVPKDGWHDISVKVAKPGTFTIQARQGYSGG